MPQTFSIKDRVVIEDLFAVASDVLVFLNGELLTIPGTTHSFDQVPQQPGELLLPLLCKERDTIALCLEGLLRTYIKENGVWTLVFNRR